MKPGRRAIPIRNTPFEGFRFKRLVTAENYIVDFVCFEARLIVEVDGSQHAECEYDKARNVELSRAGFRILRILNDDIIRNLDGECREILMELRNVGQ